MSTFVGLLCIALGALCIVAGVRGRGSQLFTATTGTPILGAGGGGTTWLGKAKPPATGASTTGPVI